MAWEIETSDEFSLWYRGLTDSERKSVAQSVDLLKEVGPTLGRPHVDTLHNSEYANMKELRVQHEGRPFRVLFIFGPKRIALLILGGDKTGDKRWYKTHIPTADRICAEHLKTLHKK